MNQAGTEKRFSAKTERKNIANGWILLTSFLFMLALSGHCYAQTPPPEVKAEPSISQLVPLELHSGTNDVIFWGTRVPWGGGTVFHQPGKIYQLETEGVVNTYYATIQWSSPSYLIPLEDGIPYVSGDDSDVPASNYIGNMDVFESLTGKTSNIPKNILIQHVAFFNGLLNGRKQTFFVRAQLDTASDDAAWSRSRPVEIDIFAFSSGTVNSFNPPGFQKVDGFRTKYNYCDAEYAMLVTLPIVPAPLKQLDDLQVSAKPSLQNQICIN